MDLSALREFLYKTVPNDVDNDDDDRSLYTGGYTPVFPLDTIIEEWLIKGGAPYDMDFDNPDEPDELDELDDLDSEYITVELDEPDNLDSEFVQPMGGSAEDVTQAMNMLDTLDNTYVPSGPQLSLVVPISNLNNANMVGLKNESFKNNILNLLNNIIL